MKALFRKLTVAIVAVCAAGFFAGCELEDDAFTGIRFTKDGCYAEAGSEVYVSAVFINNDKENKNAVIKYSIDADLSDSTGSFLDKTSAASGEAIKLTLGSKVGITVIKAEYDTYTARTACGVEAETISINDKPIGFAQFGVEPSKMKTVVTVSNAADLKKYAKQGGCLIYVDGVIDMSEGILPIEGKTMDGNNATPAMNAFIASNSEYSTYADWIKNMTTNSWINSHLNDKGDTNTLSISNTYKNKIQIQIASNTAIIGLPGAVIRGVNFSIKSNNVVIRNLTLKDSVDPFPHHENGDGWNAQHDLISIDKGTNIWIDHCSFEDTLNLGTAANGEKWQIYDGLCDMKSSATNITVSYCVFKNHDKTMLIGSGDSDGDNTKRFITLANNYWLNCGQRCPFVRNSRIHVYNNVYDSDAYRHWTSQTSINARAGSIVCAQNNYFGSVTSQNEQGGTIYISDSAIFDLAPKYGYVLRKTSSDLRNLAGPGKLSVTK